MDKANNIPSISVIVPVFGVEQYIERCVRSLMEQTIDNIEYIFVNDVTPDRSIEIIEKTIADYPERLPYIKILHQLENRGLTCARNRGLAEATGDYIYHCDSDDRLDVSMLEKLYRKASAEDLDFVWCDFYRETNDGIFPEKTARYVDDKLEMLRNYLTYGWNVVWNTICKRSLYTNNNIKSLETISFCEDYELMTRLMFCASSWGKVTESLYYYNRKNISSMVNISMSSKHMKRTIDNGIEAVLSIATFIYSHDRLKYESLKKEIHWNVLNAKKFLCFQPRERSRYLEIMPECHSDINSNPLCSRWHKWMQHLILTPVTAPIAWLFGIVYRIAH